jgi:hypothetical protein
MLRTTYDILYEQEKEPVNVEPKITSKGVEYVQIMGN